MSGEKPEEKERHKKKERPHTYAGLEKRLTTKEEELQNLSLLHWHATRALCFLQREQKEREARWQAERAQQEIRARMHHDAIHALGCFVEACACALDDAHIHGLSLQQGYVRQKEAIAAIRRALEALQGERLFKLSDHL